jgi:2-oxoisovalerate dehydrogenase E2 component (dihydrolipoyl transacylase)
MTALIQTVSEFRLPDVGEGLEEAEIVEWKIAVGDVVAVNQPIVDIETAKSLVELPSPFAGVVLELLVGIGETVSVGAPIIRIGVDGVAPADLPSVEPATASPAATPAAAAPAGARTEILVGSGPRNEEGTSRRGRVARNYGARDVVAAVAPVVIEAPAPTARTAALATPPVRKFARDLGVDLIGLQGSGPRGSVTRDDVRAAVDAQREPAVGFAVQPVAGARETRVPIRGVRKATAAAMVASAFTAPHVTEFITVDVTASMRLLERLRADREFSGIRLSPLTLLARVMCIAARRTPEVNSRWDEAAQEIATMHYVNLGIAAATDRGLLVPNIKDADQLDLRSLAVAITEAADAARTGRTTPAQMTGGTMSITNVGVFGVDTGTPILPPGESAIVCLGAVTERPWVVDHQLAVRQVTTLGLSFDHRLVDGAQGSRFLADVAAMLREPELALAWL